MKTFGDLKIGEKFIAYEGDKEDLFFIFIKTAQLEERSNWNNSLKLSTGEHHFQPDSMPIIRVK